MTTKSDCHLLIDLQLIPDDCEFGIFLPTHALFPPQAAAVLMTMPIVDTNETVQRHVKGARLGPNRIYAGIFAADPFADWSEMEEALRASGIAGVINFPSVSLHDDETANHLQQVDLGFESECERLAGLQEAGFRIALLLRNSEQATAARHLRPDFIVFYDAEALDDLRIAQQCREFCGVFGDVPVHRYHRGSLTQLMTNVT